MHKNILKYGRFIFDGLDSKDNFGIIRCRFDTEQDEFSGGEIDTSTYLQKDTNEWKITSSKYSSPVSFPISFCKCNGENFSFSEMKKISKWLMNKDYRLMQFYTESGEISEDICYECKTVKNIEWKFVGENCIGGTANVICKHSYARTKDIIKTFKFEGQNSYTFFCDSDTEYVHPDITIFVEKSGNIAFTIVSSTHNSYSTEIKNCKEGETIKIDCTNKIITTDSLVHDDTLPNDFNYIFQKITGGSNEINSLTLTGYCTITMKYYEARKVII